MISGKYKLNPKKFRSKAVDQYIESRRALLNGSNK